MRNAHLIIHGKVQGVFFRESVKRMANSYGITGWIRNTSEGTVELSARGSDESIEKLLKWCESGPKHAEVDRVEEIQDNNEEFFEDFIIKFDN